MVGVSLDGVLFSPANGGTIGIGLDYVDRPTRDSRGGVANSVEGPPANGGIVGAGLDGVVKASSNGGIVHIGLNGVVVAPANDAGAGLNGIVGATRDYCVERIRADGVC